MLFYGLHHCHCDFIKDVGRNRYHNDCAIFCSDVLVTSAGKSSAKAAAGKNFLAARALERLRQFSRDT